MLKALFTAAKHALIGACISTKNFTNLYVSAQGVTLSRPKKQYFKIKLQPYGKLTARYLPCHILLRALHTQKAEKILKRGGVYYFPPDMKILSIEAKKINNIGQVVLDIIFVSKDPNKETIYPCEVTVQLPSHFSTT